ncbi:hypothetical protein MK489_03065 [Myxococcota bacterium]|nr:hypothetical protein [Myxococcota bacterium]
MIETTRKRTDPPRWIHCFLYLFLGIFSLAVSGPAFAQHLVSGCLKLEDGRGGDAPPGRGGINAVDEVEVEIYYTDLFGNEHKALPLPGSDPIQTGENGCFGARLTLVPDVTTVRPAFVLNEEDRKVRKAAATWRLSLPSEFDAALTAGEAAVFGTPGSPLVAADHEDNGALQMWVNAEDVVNLYEDAIGPWSTASLSRPKITVRYPAATERSNANPTRIAITEESRTKWRTFLHEFGHYFSMNDASFIEIPPSYCQDKAATSWPFVQSPYTYEDPGSWPSCPHSHRSYEHEKNALIEGFAAATEFFLIDDDETFDASTSTSARYCSRRRNQRLEDNNRNPHYYNSVNFDGEWNEGNVAQAICDLLDNDAESITYLHQFGDPGHLTSIALGSFVPNPLSTVGMNPTHTYAAQGDEIFQIEFATGNVSLLFDAGTGSDVELVTADANQVCASDGDEVNCFSLATAGPVTSVALPSSIASNGIRDIQLSGGELFILASHISFSTPTVKLHRYDASASVWHLVYSENVLGVTPANQPQRFALASSSPTAKLFLARANRVEMCDVSSCASTRTHYVGDAGGDAGYRRGDASTALLNGIGQLVRIPGGTVLAIADFYGVSVIHDGDTRLEQWIGRGLDRVYENNISRRGLVLGSVFRGEIEPSVRTLYATNGSREIVLDNQGTDFRDDRTLKQDETVVTSVFPLETVTLPLTRGYLIDASITTTDEFFCAEENVSLSPETVFTMFDGNPFYNNIRDALASYLPLTNAQELAVSETSWLTLPPPGNCEAENIRRERYDFSTGGGGGEADNDERDGCGGYVEPDENDLIEYGFFDGELSVTHDGEDEQPFAIDPKDLPVLTGGDCSGGGGEDTDGDGVCDAFDNCLVVANPAQVDTDADGFGNRCDADYDNNGAIGSADFMTFRAAFGSSVGNPRYDPQVEVDGNGVIGSAEFATFRSLFITGVPGPSGLSCATLPPSAPCP